MSAWGSGTFENDDAHDPSRELHSRAIDDLRQILPRPVSCEIAEWVSKAPVASPVRGLARRVVNKVRLHFELKDLWLEANGLNEWSASLRDLEPRLSG